MNYIKLFEEFEEFKKPNFLQRAFKSTKRFIGVESKDDRESLDTIYRTLSSDFDFVKGIREIKPGVVICNLVNGNITVDLNDKTIIFRGKELELSDMDYECQRLYKKIKNYETSKNI